MPLFDRIRWKDPLSGQPLQPRVTTRTPAGVPLSGALQLPNSRAAYPIVDCVARLTPETAACQRPWLEALGLEPPVGTGTFQAVDEVESFGWQWTWSSEMRSEQDLRFRVAERFGLVPEFFRSKLVLDAGAGAGDQSRYLLDQGAEVVSLDLSGAIDVVAGKLRLRQGWAGVQGDITCLPLEPGQFDVVYCEGVLQHTRDTDLALRQLCSQLKPGGLLLATHYVRPAAVSRVRRLVRKVSTGYYEFLRARLSRLERFKLLLVTGVLAALNYVPLLGHVLRRAGMVKYYNLMPGFRTTWTNTFDFFGSHAHQRIITPERFLACFDGIEGIIVSPSAEPGVVLARRS
ncbi:class I SAM-dependent methyltransferase [bacterium]|nr:class I SAM-dependent methyltransferase [bacterium]